MRVLGVDPGGGGALALVSGVDLIAVADMPAFEVRRGRGVKKEIDVHGLIRLLDEWAPECCWFERVGGMTGESASGAFNFGRAAGMCEALVKASGARFEFVSPHIWKKEMGLVHCEKDEARVRAINRWPGMAGQFSRKKDVDRADAALIAEYGRLELHKEGIFA